LLPALHGLDDDRARFYYDLMYNALNEAARRALEAMMKSYDYQSDFAKKYVAQGRTEGRTEGHREGRKDGERALLLRLLRARFGELPAGAVARVESAEIAVLERWGERVLSAKTLADVLDEPS
jgi:predicted transposase YdaD